MATRTRKRYEAWLAACEQRRLKAAKLRAKGWTLERIGRAMGGISRQAVHSMLRGQP